MTHQRRVILDEIRRVTTHPTADELYEMVRKKMPHISLGTVYRNLETLSSLGLIQKIGPLSSQMRFDGNTTNHYHIRCIYCGRLEDAPIEPVDAMDNAIQGKTNFIILGHRVVFLGICPECRKNGRDSNDA